MNEKQSLCIDIEPLLDAYRDKELDVVEQTSVSAHLVSCLSCQGKLADIEKIVGALKELPRLELKIDYADDLDKLLTKAQPAKVLAPPAWKKPVVWQATITAAAAIALAIVAGQYFTGNNGLIAQKPDPSKVAHNQTANPAVNHSSNDVSQLAANNKTSDSEPVTEILGNQQPINDGHLNNSNSLPASGNTSGANDTTTHIASNTANTSVEESIMGQASDDGPDAVIALVDSDQKTASEAIGIETDEDGLYALKL